MPPLGLWLVKYKVSSLRQYLAHVVSCFYVVFEADRLAMKDVLDNFDSFEVNVPICGCESAVVINEGQGIGLT